MADLDNAIANIEVTMARPRMQAIAIYNLSIALKLLKKLRAELKPNG